MTLNKKDSTTGKEKDEAELDTVEVMRRMTRQYSAHSVYRQSVNIKVSPLMTSGLLRRATQYIHLYNSPSSGSKY